MDRDYLALLRGINVGGKNIIKMGDLADRFEHLGFTRVRTYIQSGNVIFSSGESAAEIGKKIELELSASFNYSSTVVLLPGTALQSIVLKAPKDFGSRPEKFKYDVMYIKAPVTSSEVIRSLSVKEDVDAVAQGNGVVYFSRLIARASQSHLTKIIQLPVYKHITIRNWNTTTKLLSLLSSRHSDDRPARQISQRACRVGSRKVRNCGEKKKLYIPPNPQRLNSPVSGFSSEQR